MTQLYRARLSLLAATGLAAAVLVFELPIGELLHQGGELSSVAAQLSKVRSENNALAGEIAGLHRDSTVEALAHEEYGLVAAGQRSYSVATPPSSPATITPDLVQHRLPSSDLVVESADAPSSTSARNVDGTSATGSIWSRAADRLEFWRWAF